MLECQWEMEEELWAYRASSCVPVAAGHMPAPVEGLEAPPVCDDVASEVSFVPIPTRAPANPKELSMPRCL